VCKRFVIGDGTDFNTQSVIDAFPKLVIVPSFMVDSVDDWAIFGRIVSGSSVIGFAVEDEGRSERDFGFCLLEVREVLGWLTVRADHEFGGSILNRNGDCDRDQHGEIKVIELN